MFDLNQVRLFAEVVRAGSFAAASRRLGIPPNTASRQIGALEAALGVRLLHRSTRKLSLTSAGQRFHARCADAVAQLEAAASDLSEEGGAAAGTIRVAAPAGFFDSFAMDWLAEFLAEHPRVRCEFLLEDAATDLIRESIDVAIRGSSGAVEVPGARKLAASGTGLVASPRYLERHGVPATLQALVRHDCLTFASRPGAALWQLRGADGTREVRVNGRFAANTATALLQAAVAGMGIALLPTILTAPEVARGALLPVLPTYRREDGGLYALVPAGRAAPRAAQAFVDFVARKLAAPPWRPR